MRMTPTAAYIRVSTNEQKLYGISLDAQRDKLRTYAHDNNLQIVNWYEDEGVSGRKLIKNRPALQRMIQDAERGKFEHIIFIKLDRFFRSVAEYHECMKRLGDVTWDATEEKYDLTTASGRLLVNSKLMVAEYEADTTGERIIFNNDYKVKTGQPLSGKVPYGFKIIKTDNGKRIVLDEETKDQALSIINYYLKTNSLNGTVQYSRDFHFFGTPTNLRKYLTNTMLYGSYRGNNTYCEQLIDKATFDRLQAKLERNTRQHGKTEHPYLFRKMLICPECGTHLTTSGTTINGTKYYHYRCHAKRYAGTCNYTKILNESKVEKCLLDNLESYIENQNLRVVQKKKRPVSIKAIKDEISRLNYMFQKGYLDVSIYEEQYKELNDKLTDATTEPPDDRAKIDRINKIISEGWENVYHELDTEHRAQFWHMIAKDILIEIQDGEYILKDIIFL